MELEHKKIAWCFQLIIAGIFIPIGILKFMNNPADLEIFSQLGMEPAGRYIIGVLEILAGLMVLTNAVAAMGAFLGVGVMLGAMLAHMTVLGIDQTHFILLFIVFLSCCIVSFIRRKQLPLIGNIF